MMFRAFLLAAAVGVPVLSAGCATVPGLDAEDAAELAGSEDELRASCTYPRRYIATVGDGECSEVVARRGRWVPSPLFDDAPELTGACFYTWSGEKYARVDRAALREHIVFPNTLTPSCGAERVDEDAELVEIPGFSPGGMAGAIGCDVCGIQRDGNVWVVLPPEQVYLRELQVRLTNGQFRSFKIEASESARRLSLALPPPPAGTRYENGRVAIQ